MTRECSTQCTNDATHLFTGGTLGSRPQPFCQPHVRKYGFSEDKLQVINRRFATDGGER